MSSYAIRREAKRVVYEPVQLAQDFRTFDFMSPWEGAEYILPGDEKGMLPEAKGCTDPTQGRRDSRRPMPRVKSKAQKTAPIRPSPPNRTAQTGEPANRIRKDKPRWQS